MPALRTIRHAIKTLGSKTLWAFTPRDLLCTLRKLGINKGDVVMVHASFVPLSGFKGGPHDLIEVFLQSVGPAGTLAMMSMPYHGMSSFDYLQQGKVFDARRTVSMVGLVSEVFRRRADVIRSLHPTHSVAAWGNLASRLVSAEPEELSPFGRGSSLDRLYEARAKILFYDAPFNTMTFEHYLEHRIRDLLPVPLYRPDPVVAYVIDCQNQLQTISTLVLNEGLGGLRRSDILERELISQDILRRTKLGRSKIMLARTDQMVELVDSMAKAKKTLHSASFSDSNGTPSHNRRKVSAGMFYYAEH